MDDDEETEWLLWRPADTDSDSDPVAAAATANSRDAA
jgi:hypothetical protein